MTTTALGEAQDDEIDVVVVPAKMEATLALKQPHVQAFIQRIYIILTIQLALTCGVAYAFVKIPVIQKFVISNMSEIMLFTSGLLLCGSLSLMFVSCTRRMSGGFMAFVFGLMAICIGILAACLVVIYSSRGSGDIVFQAAVMTMTIFVSLTIFTFQTKIDFTFMGGFLFMCTVGMIVWSLIIYCMGFQTSYLLSLFGTILFSLWILYDTSVIIERSQYLTNGEIPSWKEALIYATNLYVDIIQIFLYLLDLLNR